MSLTEADLALCREQGREIVKEVLKEHIKSCPHHQNYLISKARVIGLFFGVVIASGVTSGTIFAIIMKVITK